MNEREAEAILLRHSRREAAVVIVVWVLALLWVVGYCYLYGYAHDAQSWPVRWGLTQPRDADDLKMIAGFPDWVFVGIMVPWLICTVFTIIFCFFMTDDDLGPTGEDIPDGH
jgi:hypothetical protein